MHDTIWAQSTIEELLSRQFVRPSRCASQHRSNNASPRRPVRDAAQGAFRPGLRVVAIDGLQIDRWVDDPVVVTIDG